MKIKPSLRQRGMALICVIILVGMVLIIAGSIIYMLFKLCQKCLPPKKDDNHNDLIEQTTNAVTELAPIQMPMLVFPNLAKPPGWTQENPIGFARVELQRSTNLIDWEVIIVSTNPAYVPGMYDDTNPPPDKAFYRGNFVYP